MKLLKYKLLLILTFLIIMLVACSDSLKVPKLEDIEAVVLIPSHAGAGAYSLPLLLDNTKDKAVLTKILGWLTSSKAVGESKSQFVSHGSNPTVLQIKLHNRDSIQIEDAVDGISTKLVNGIQIQSKPVKDQITLALSGKKGIRLDSPELKEWIQDGWSKEDVFQFTQTDAIAKVREKQPEFPTSADQVKTNCENVGGEQGSRVEVKLTTKVEERGRMEYVVTLSKNYQLTVGGKQVVTYWKYNVNPNGATLIDSKDEMPAIK